MFLLSSLIVPSKPGAITINSIDSLSMQITWLPAFGLFNVYRVYALENENPNPNPNPNPMLSGVVPRTEDRSFTVDNLQPDTSYTISVTTESGMVGSLTKSAPREIIMRTSTLSRRQHLNSD